MEFECEEEKNSANVAKHGIAFEDAKGIFDGFTFRAVDDRRGYGEVREISIGRMNEAVVIVVVHTDRRGTCRIISARRRRGGKGIDMNKRYERPLSAAELAKRTDSDIDTGDDIPDLDEAFWSKAELTVPQTKSVVSLRLSNKVIEHFKRRYLKGYTSRMADVLASYVNAQPK